MLGQIEFIVLRRRDKGFIEEGTRMWDGRLQAEDQENQFVTIAANSCFCDE